MKKTINLATISIDGLKLKAAREERGISAADIAASLTLSRAQIIHIEDGGDKPFYSPAHKLLAVRKYAKALNIPYEDVVLGEGSDQTVPAPEEAPPSMRTYSTNIGAGADLTRISATEDRMIAASRNNDHRRYILFGAIALCVVIALYAKMRGSSEEAKLPENAQTQEELLATEPAIETPLADAAPAAPAAPAEEPKFAAAPEVISDETPAKSKHAEQPEAAKAVAVAVAAAETPQDEVSASEDNCAPEPTGGILKTWSPAYQRKADTRLFVISPKGGTVCVTDNNGKSRQVSLKPMVGEPFSGKPPYTIRAKHLSSLDMYMQGLRVKVPADAKVMRLVPTSATAPESEAVADTDISEAN